MKRVMSAGLQERRIPMSWDEYLSLDDDVRGEYFDGALTVSPSPTLVHQRICHSLVRLITDVLPDGVEVTGGWGWRVGQKEFVPDVMVFDTPSEMVRLMSVPRLVIEVLSTDRKIDQVHKKAEYAAAGLGEYWIVNPDGPVITCYELSGGVFEEASAHGPGGEAGLVVCGRPLRVSLDTLSG